MSEDQNIIVGLNIDVTDKSDMFELHHYRECDINSDFYVKECRGLIYDNNKVLTCKTFSFTPEKLWNEPDMEESVNNMIQSQSRFYPSYEGTILRLYNYQDKWYLSTHKKLDAFKSRWGSEISFGDYFVKCLESMVTKDNEEFFEPLYEKLSNINEETSVFEKYCSLLNKNIIYTYLIRTCNKNRIVCRYDSSKLFFVGAFDKENNFIYIDEKSVESFVQLVPTININTYEDFINTINNNDLDVRNEWKTQGFVVIDKTGSSIKYLNPEYYKWISVRGNNPILLQRYIELKKDFTGNVMLYNFLALYSDVMVKVGQNDIRLFDDYERVITNIKNNLFFHYKKRYIYKQKSVVPPEQHKVLLQMFDLYINYPSNNALSQQWVSYVVDSLDNVTLYNLYKQFKYREQQYGNGNKINNELVQKVDVAYYKNKTQEETSSK